MKNNLKFYHWKEFFKTVKNVEFQLWWGQRWKICKDWFLAMCDTITKSETAKNRITGLKHANRCRRHFWNLGWNRKGWNTHPKKNLTAPNRTILVLPICFSRCLEFGPKLDIWLWRKNQMVQSMPAVCPPKWSSLFGAIFSERVK